MYVCMYVCVYACVCVYIYPRKSRDNVNLLRGLTRWELRWPSAGEVGGGSGGGGGVIDNKRLTINKRIRVLEDLGRGRLAVPVRWAGRTRGAREISYIHHYCYNAPPGRGYCFLEHSSVRLALPGAPCRAVFHASSALCWRGSFVWLGVWVHAKLTLEEEEECMRALILTPTLEEEEEEEE